MAVSLEARAPLLDYRLAEFAGRLPVSMKISGGEGKRVLRQLLYGFLPSSMFERPKQGFSLPLGAWLRGELRDWAEDLLGPAEGLLDAAYVQKIWRQHLAGTHAWEGELWNLLMLLAWLRRWRPCT